MTGLTDGALTTNITVVDSSAPQLQQIATINCPAVPALQVSPPSYTYSATATPPAFTCAAATSKFAINGGLPPYTATFTFPGTVGVIAPVGPILAGQGFTVTGLANTVQNNQITVRDASAPQNFVIVNVNCLP